MPTVCPFSIKKIGGFGLHPAAVNASAICWPYLWLSKFPGTARTDTSNGQKSRRNATNFSRWSPLSFR